MRSGPLPTLVVLTSGVLLSTSGLSAGEKEAPPPSRTYSREGTPRAAKPPSTAAKPALRAPQGTNIVLNGGFESNGGVGTNVFADWTVENLFGGFGDWLVQTGSTSPLNGFPVDPPPEGNFAAMTDQTGPGSHVIHQVLAVPPAGVILSCQVYVNNQAVVYSNPASLDWNVLPNQQARIDIMNPAAPIDDVGAGVLLNMFATPPGTPPVIPYTTVTANLSPFAGTSVRLRIAEVDNQGFMHFGVDNCSSVDVPVELMGFSVE
jgi:hypothetical protein